nr:uncharacterized protein LOC107972042 isoform X1 [Pan troglodytes]
MKDLLLLGSPFQRFRVSTPFVTSYKGLANTAKFGIHSLQNPTAPKNSLTCLLPLSSGRLQITCFLSVPELGSDPSRIGNPTQGTCRRSFELSSWTPHTHSPPGATWMKRGQHCNSPCSCNIHGYSVERQQVQSPKDYKGMLLTIIFVTKAAKLFLYLGTVFPDKPENSDKATSLGIRTEKARVMEISPALSQEKVSAPQTAPTEVAALPAACRC